LEAPGALELWCNHPKKTHDLAHIRAGFLVLSCVRPTDYRGFACLLTQPESFDYRLILRYAARGVWQVGVPTLYT